MIFFIHYSYDFFSNFSIINSITTTPSFFPCFLTVVVEGAAAAEATGS